MAANLPHVLSLSHSETSWLTDSRPQVHVIWINKDLKLSEKVRIEGETTWKSIAFPTEFKPTATSRLGSGVCHDNHDDQSHQWVHFVELVASTLSLSLVRC